MAAWLRVRASLPLFALPRPLPDSVDPDSRAVRAWPCLAATSDQWLPMATLASSGDAVSVTESALLVSKELEPAASVQEWNAAFVGRGGAALVAHLAAAAFAGGEALARRNALRSALNLQGVRWGSCPTLRLVREQLCCTCVRMPAPRALAA